MSNWLPSGVVSHGWALTTKVSESNPDLGWPL